MREYEGMVQVYTAESPAEAHLIAGALEEEGISTQIHNEALFSALGEVGMDMNGMPSVWVSTEDAERAVAFIEAHREHMRQTDSDEE